MLELSGVVSRVRFRDGRREYTLTDGTTDTNFSSDEPLAQGNCITLQGEMTAGGIRAGRVIVLGGKEEKELLGKTMDNIKKGAAFPNEPAILSDGETKRIFPMLKEAAGEIICARKLGRSVLVRFHGDADGISAAFAITSVLRAKAFQQNSAIYSVKDALRDLAFIGQESRPLAILVDFGSSSKEGLEILKAAGLDYLIIDHHPYESPDNPSIINPLKLDPGFSKFCAGYLCCEIAAMCGMKIGAASSWAKVACSGDKSEILKSGPEDAKKAIVLDFLSSHVSYGNNLEFYQKVMGQDELFNSIAVQAEQSIEEASQKAMARMKKAEGRVDAFSFSLDGIAKKDEWPPSGKITTRVFDKLKGDTPLLCIGYTDRSIIMRLNDEAVSAGLSANLLAQSMKASMPDFVEGGGGHDKAGAIRVKEGFVKEVLNQLLGKIS